jgi:adenylate cyclase
MNEPDTNTLRHDLARERRKLDLIMALDNIRDVPQEPAAMLSSIVNRLADEFSAALVLLILFDRDTGELELRAITDRSRRFGSLTADALREVARRIIKKGAIAVWEGEEIQAALGMPGEQGLQVAAVPIILGTKLRLGALLVARIDKPFDQDEMDLLDVAESQLDSAVIQSYDYYELHLRNRELETIYRVDRIRDENMPFDDMLTAVLQELRKAIPSEMGFIMLYDRGGDRLELRAVAHDDLFRVSGYYDVIDEVGNEALHVGHAVFHNDRTGDLHSIVAIPLILRNEILGVFGVVNSASGSGFEEGERRLLTAIASQMDTAIFESMEQRRLRRVLGRSVDPRILERLLANPDVDFLKGERSVVTVLYADVRGSTSLAERTEPEQLVGFLNDYLGRMADIVFEYDGTLDKFVGDEVMALFSAPFDMPDHALRAVRVGLAMQQAHAVLMEEWKARGLDAAPIGVGIATGEMIVGEIGSVHRTDYTVIGQAANLGSRICGVALPGQVLISQATYELVMGQVEAKPIPGLELKGVHEPVTVYDVTRILE